MTTNAENILQTYLQTTEELRKVLVSFTATPAQKDAAEATLADLTTVLAMHGVQQVEGRTALLTGLYRARCSGGRSTTAWDTACVGWSRPTFGVSRLTTKKENSSEMASSILKPFPVNAVRPPC